MRSKIRKSQNSRAGIIFPITRIRRSVLQMFKKKRLSKAMPVYLAAVMEYLCAEIMDLASDAAKACKKKRITPRHIFLAVINDLELKELLKKAIIPQGGVKPNLLVELLPKPNETSSSSKPKVPANKDKSSVNVTKSISPATKSKQPKTIMSAKKNKSVTAPATRAESKALATKAGGKVKSTVSLTKAKSKVFVTKTKTVTKTKKTKSTDTKIKARASITKVKTRSSVRNVKATTSVVKAKATTSVVKAKATTSIVKAKATTSVTKAKATTSVTKAKATTSVTKAKATTSVTKAKATTSVTNTKDTSVTQLIQNPVVRSGRSSRQSSPTPSIDTTDPNAASIAHVAKLFHGQQLIVLNQNLLQVHVDAIVHPTNSSFFMGGQIGQSLVNIGGDNFKDIMTQLKIDQRSLAESSAVISRSCNIPAKFIIHCNGPLMTDTDLSSKLAKTLHSCLKVADDKSLNTVAFPLIGTGRGGVSVDIAVEVLLETAVKYFKSVVCTSLSILYVVLKDDVTVTSVVHKLKNMIL